MIKTIIVEDEPRALNLLKRYIASYCPELQIIGTAKDANTAFEIIQQYKPELLFLDIEISNEDSPATSFDLLARLPEYPYEVIFVTAFNDYMHQAFKSYALGYLLKPVNIDELENAVAMAKKRINLNKQNLQLIDFIRQNQNPEQTNNRLWIPVGDGMEAISISDIIRFEAEGRCTFIHLNKLEKILSSRSLREYLNLLREHPNFIHTHRSHYINDQYVSKIVSKDGSYLLMTDGKRVPISRRKKQDVIKALNRF